MRSAALSEPSAQLGSIRPLVSGAQAVAYYRTVGDTSKDGVVQVKMGVAIGSVDAERGVRHIRYAIPLIDAKWEPRVWLLRSARPCRDFQERTMREPGVFSRGERCAYSI
jgi:hypothetical protein